MTVDPPSPIAGSAGGLIEFADQIEQRGRNARAVGESLQRIDTGGWTGAAADAWRQAHDADIPRWFQAADSLDSAAGALRVHAEILAWAQRRAVEGIDVWNRSAPDAAGDADRRAALTMVDDVRRQVRDSALRTADLLRTGSEAAPQDSQKKADENFYGGIWDTLKDAAVGAVGTVVDPAGAAASVVDAAAHPARTARDMVAWDDWAAGHGDRALGRLTGSAVLAAGTYGAGKVASVVARRTGGRHGVGEEPDATGTPRAAGLPGDPLQPAIDYATRQPKMDHVFVPKHKLDPLVEHFGDQHAAMVEIVRRLGSGNDLPPSGPFEVVRQIEGQPVHIRGAVVNGTPKIGTVFTP